MPFNIDLEKEINNVSVKIQIVKNTINFYFIGGTEKNRDEALQRWGHLQTHFSDQLPGYNKLWFRGKDELHLKRNHTNQLEVGNAYSDHFHAEFNTEITPEIFALYINHFFSQQEEKEHQHPSFQFFKHKGEVSEIVQKFKHFYNDTIGGKLEKDFETETALTEKEDLEYNQAKEKSKNKKDAHIVIPSSLLPMLLLQSIFNDNMKIEVKMSKTSDKPTGEHHNNHHNPNCVIF